MCYHAVHAPGMVGQDDIDAQKVNLLGLEVVSHFDCQPSRNRGLQGDLQKETGRVSLSVSQIGQPQVNQPKNMIYLYLQAYCQGKRGTLSPLPAYGKDVGILDTLAMTAGIVAQPESRVFQKSNMSFPSFPIKPWMCLQLSAAGTGRHDCVPVRRVFFPGCFELGDSLYVGYRMTL